jgi:DNA-directed RNA polymerase specialized sigma24 family protein
MTHYGVTTVEAYLYEGIGMTEALGKGLKAMSSWAISETRGTTSRAKAFKEDPTVNYASTVVPAKFLPELGVEELGVQEVEVLDTLRSLPGLDDMDREVLYLRSRGFEIKEIGDLVGLTKSGAFVRLKTAAEKARRVWADPVS